MENKKDIYVHDPDNNFGSIRIADDVVGIVAGLATVEVAGVAGMSGGISGGISEILGRKNLAKGVKVEVGEKEAAVDIYVIVEFGIPITEVAANIQENVKKSIEGMTGLNVVEVNIHVQGVHFSKEEEKIEEQISRVR